MECVPLSVISQIVDSCRMLLSQLSQRPSSPLLLRRAPPYLSDFLQVSRIAQIGQRCSRARMLFFICLCLAPRERRHWRARARWIEGQILAISTLIEARNCAFFSRSRCSLFYRAPAHYLREMSASDKLIHITSNDNESPNILKRHRNFAEVCDFFLISSKY